MNHTWLFSTKPAHGSGVNMRRSILSGGFAPRTPDTLSRAPLRRRALGRVAHSLRSFADAPFGWQMNHTLAVQHEVRPTAAG